MTPLADLLKRRIRDSGPVSVAEYIALALGHPGHGYYRSRDPLGAQGDFVTAPEISQMFGELIGLWCAVVWQTMGSPERIVLAELGPGRGTLMADLLRTVAASVPAFRAGIEVHLVETSPALRDRQAAALRDVAVTWHEDIGTLPAGPLLVVANEFFDALPIRQFVRRDRGWRERMVGLDGDRFVFVEGDDVALAAPPAADGDIFERADVAAGIAASLGGRLAAAGGAALIIDYGHPRTAIGDTLQAVRGHGYAGIFDNPGEVDLTAHVDFEALAMAARPARAWGPIGQGQFLRALGIEMRAVKLMAANPHKAQSIDEACRRLIDAAEMGTLFKVLALADPALPAPPGFAAGGDT